MAVSAKERERRNRDAVSPSQMPIKTLLFIDLCWSLNRNANMQLTNRNRVDEQFCGQRNQIIWRNWILRVFDNELTGQHRMELNRQWTFCLVSLLLFRISFLLSFSVLFVQCKQPEFRRNGNQNNGMFTKRRRSVYLNKISQNPSTDPDRHCTQNEFHGNQFQKDNKRATQAKWNGNESSANKQMINITWHQRLTPSRSKNVSINWWRKLLYRRRKYCLLPIISRST